MSPDDLPISPPGLRVHLSLHLLSWHPGGVLDAILADEILRFIEFAEERLPEPCNRFVDFSALDAIHLSFHEVQAIAARRIDKYYGVPVKTAILAVNPLAFGIARMYEQLMLRSPIDVGVFRDVASAATWLNVPIESLAET